MTVTEPAVVWAPDPGPVSDFLECPFRECLLHGPRGGGKSDGMLMDFAKDIGQGYGRDWKGVLFRQTYKQLKEVVERSRKWFGQIFPDARFVQAGADGYTWHFATGEQLMFRHARVPSDYWNYHGWEIPWLGWEELTTWPDLELYHMMKSTNRSSNKAVATIRRIRANTNSWGPGHNAVKAYFISPASYVSKRLIEGNRTNVFVSSQDNKHLLEADPEYFTEIESAATSPGMKQSWLGTTPHQCWDVTSGGMFDDLWQGDTHVLEAFSIPETWHLTRCMDWGSSKPFSVGWYAESDGSQLPDGRAWPRGTVFRIAEWYGWNQTPNHGLKLLYDEIAAGIVERERSMRIAYGWPDIRPGPADAPEGDDGVNLRDKMGKLGAKFTEPDKRPGSRKAGWETCRQRLKAATRQPMEDPGFYVFDTCPQFIRTVPPLPRDLDKDPDDVDTDAEDHCADEWRYRLQSRRVRATIGRF